MSTMDSTQDSGTAKKSMPPSSLGDEYENICKRSKTNLFAAIGVGILGSTLMISQDPKLIIHHTELVWPPSVASSPFLLAVSVAFAILVYNSFFANYGDTDESKRTREVKKRLILAQMISALKWDVDEKEEDEEGEDNTGKTEKATGAVAAENRDPPPIEKTKLEKSVVKEEEKLPRKPPTTKELFEIVYDEVEERHVTEYDIPANEEPYLSVRRLFEERVQADLEEAVEYTKLATRFTDQGSSFDQRQKVCIVIKGVKLEKNLDQEDMKKITEFKDGTKLVELIELCKTQISKNFGKNIVPAELMQEAEVCRRATQRNQQKSWVLLVPIVMPLLPYYMISIFLMTFDSLVGAALWHSLATNLDGIDKGTMSEEELKWITLRNEITFFFCIFAHLSSHSFAGKVASTFRFKVRSHLMRCMVRQDMAFFDIIPSAKLQERLNSDAEQLADKLFHVPLSLLHQVVLLLTNLYTVYNLKPGLCLMIFLPIPMISVAQYYIFKYMEKIDNRQRKIKEASAAGTMEVLKEIRTVREFAMEDEEAEKFQENEGYRQQIEEYGDAVHHIILLSPLICTMASVRNVATFLCGSYVASHVLTVGQAVQISFCADQMQHNIRDIISNTPRVARMLNPLGRICDMLMSKPKVEPVLGDPVKFQPKQIEGRIEFDKVEFTFPSEPHKQVLHGISFRVNPGQSVAFVGATGCGKSTSIKLIERFYDPTAGRILLDGRPIGDYDIHHLRGHLSVVAQDNVLFATTIRENIIYGLPREERERIKDDAIEAACKKANAWKFIQEFPRGLETYVGEKGVKMSGGQKQRLAIARAIIRNPTIVLLDEATSALDSKAEAVVQKALDQMIEGRNVGCTIIVAHRLSTVKKCDRIIVMDKGLIVEQGPHEELLKIPILKQGEEGNQRIVTGWYHDLWETQIGKPEPTTSKTEANVRAMGLTWRVRTLEAENARLKQQLGIGGGGQAAVGRTKSLSQKEENLEWSSSRTAKNSCRRLHISLVVGGEEDDEGAWPSNAQSPSTVHCLCSPSVH